MLDGATCAEQKRRVVATIGVFELASGVVVDGEEKSGVAVVRSAVEEKLVDGVQEPREIVESDGVTAAEIGLKIGHEECAGNSLPGNVSENEGEARGAEIEEVIVVATDLARLHTGAGIVEGGERRKDLRKQPGLDVAGDIHFMSGAAFGFHAVGDVLRETNILQSDGGLTRDRIEQALVFTGVGLFGERLAEDEETNEVTAVANHRHETFG